MESPGEYLKRERDLRGVSLGKIFEATRVPMKFLEAIEADKFDGLPHKAFVKGFIRSYCKALGLDETDAVLRYEVFLREREAEAASDSRAAKSGPSKKKKAQAPGPSLNFPKNIRKYAFIAAAVVIIAAAYAVSLKKDSSMGVDTQAGSGMTEAEEALSPPFLSPETDQAPSGAEGAAGTPEKAAPEIAPEAAAPSPLKTQPERAREKDAQRAAAPVTVQEPSKGAHTLTATASEMVWIKIGIDGGEPIEVLLREGERFTWKGSEGFSVVVGNAGGVTLTYNGRELPALGAQGEVIMLKLPYGEQQDIKRAPEKAA